MAGWRYRIVYTLTVGRVPLAVLFALLYLSLGPSMSRMVLCLVVLGLVEASDGLDGYLARRWNFTSEQGAMLDPYADSVSRLVVFWSLAVAGTVLAVVPLVMAARDVTVAYTRIVLTRKRATVAAKWSGKIKAVVQAGAAFILVSGPLYHPVTGLWPNAVVSWIVIVVTCLSAVEYVLAAARTQP